jgi:hypothetical protein
MWISNDLQTKHVKVEPEVELLLDSGVSSEIKHGQIEEERT